MNNQLDSQLDSKLDHQLILALEQLLGKDRCLSCPEDLHAYSFDLFARGLPALVVLPETTREVSEILKLANRHQVFITPRGAGTSLTGGPVPQRGGIVLAMTRMDQILEISTVNRLIRVQAGVITKDLQAKANSCHLYYPPNPTSADYCTIGGNIATNAGGASGVKYGVTSDYILGLTLVLADGRILETGGKCIKSVAGFDFKRAFCGSEGLLGVITEGGGLCALHNPDLSKQLGNLKARNIVNSEAQILTAPCPGCLIQIKDRLGANNAQIESTHPIELVARTYAKDDQ